MSNVAVFIGRFQPLHNGHLQIINYGLGHADRVIVLVGGAGAARRPRGPWTFQERAEMIHHSVYTAAHSRNSPLRIVPLPDMLYNDTAWIEKVQAEVAANTHDLRDSKVKLLGRRKDGSGYYLSLFPQWEPLSVQPRSSINATAIRQELFFVGAIPETSVVPPFVQEFLTSYAGTPEYARMKTEWTFISSYQARHDNGQYHRNNICSDAVVVQAGHILLVRRKSHPGIGMLALPGGHINRDEMPLHAAIRELKEETGIKVPEPVLVGSIEKERTFADPYRSDLARTISFAYLIRLKNERGLAKLKAGSDAESALWKPINEVKEHEMFDDHYHIIRNMLELS